MRGSVVQYVQTITMERTTTHRGAKAARRRPDAPGASAATRIAAMHKITNNLRAMLSTAS
jgi:hypothetical protein